jgi:hypothetical protein
VIFFQQVASIGNNITIQIVAGQSMKVGQSLSSLVLPPAFAELQARHHRPSSGNLFCSTLMTNARVLSPIKCIPWLCMLVGRAAH